MPISADTFALTILHNNDGESKLLPDEDAGLPGVARFAAQMKQMQAAAAAAGSGVVTLTSGDNFLASQELNVSLARDGALYDSIALSGLYDAMALGNHDFDLGPEVTARFIEGFDPAVTFLSANADFSGEPVLQALVDSGVLAGSTVVETGGQQVGVIGAVTPQLRNISTPRNVVVSDVLAAVQAEVASLTAAGVDKIILVSHLQGCPKRWRWWPTWPAWTWSSPAAATTCCATRATPACPTTSRPARTRCWWPTPPAPTCR